MGIRIRHSKSVALLSLALWALAHPALGSPTPSPDPSATCIGNSAQQAANQSLWGQACISEGVSQAKVGMVIHSSGPASAPTAAQAPSRPVTTRRTTSPACYYQAIPLEFVQSVYTPPGTIDPQAAARDPRVRNVYLAPYAGLPQFWVAAGVEPYYYACGSDVTLVFVRIQAPTPAAVAPPRPVAAGTRPGQLARPVAQTLEAEITLPPLQISLNPAQAGITNLASYFWITGYDGQPRYQPAAPSTAGSIELRVTPAYYVWSFGDGSSLTTASLGHPYPQVSDIAHTYTVRSDWSPLAAPGGVYAVSVTAYFDVAYQVIVPGQSLVPNGTWVDFTSYGFPLMQETATHGYKVGEVISALTG